MPVCIDPPHGVALRIRPETYSYLGTTEMVLRVSNSSSGAVDSIATSASDRLGVAAGSTLNWFLPDPHGSVAASLSANESTVTNAIRYEAWGDTLVTGSGGGTAVGADSWKYQGRLDISPSGIGEPEGFNNPNHAAQRYS